MSSSPSAHPRRVLFLTHAYPRSASDPVGSFVLRLAVALRELGIACEVTAPSARGLLETELIEGIRVTRYRYAPTAWETLAYTGTMSQQVAGSWPGRLALAGLLANGFRVANRISREYHIDLVHAHWWFPGGVVGAALRRVRRLPLVTTLHGSDVRLARTMPGGAAAFRRVMRASDAVTTVSAFLADGARAIAPAVNAVVAPMPVADALFHPGKHRVANRLLFVGKLTEQKGIETLLRALPLLTQPYTLEVVGAGRVDDDRLRTLATALGVADRITWLPLLSQRELGVHYRDAAIHVIPARDEGLGLTAVESLLSETPVVAFDSGGVGDVVTHDRTGMLVPAGDAFALAAALDRLLEAPAMRHLLGAEGRRDMLERFSPAAVAARYADVYESALARHRAAAGASRSSAEGN